MSGHDQPAATEFPPGFEWSDDEQRPVATRYSARETGEALGVAERTVRRWIKAGRLPAEKVGGVFLIRLDDAHAALNGSRAAGRASQEQYIEWLERENERLWRLVEKAVAA
jgi:excisionase family DNA binding protein